MSINNNYYNNTITIPVNTGSYTTQWISIPAVGTGYYQIFVSGDLSGPAPVKKSAGCSCKRCKDFNEYAEVNQPDNTFICYTCRHVR